MDRLGAQLEPHTVIRLTPDTKSPRLRLPQFAMPLVLLALSVLSALIQVAQAQPGPEAPSAKPALAVTVTLAQQAVWPVRIAANGSIAAWQEASVGTEANGLRLARIEASVGDRVRRGQLLALFESSLVSTELAHSRALLAEAEAALAEAAANARRARDLQASGALSEQQIHQYLSAECMAQARRDAAEATARAQAIRLAQTEVRAPDDGVISARSATVGAVLPAGQELFRLIRRGRLEWRAEVAAPLLARIAPGQVATVTPVGGEALRGKVRVVSPAVDPQTRNGVVYVDLPPSNAARAGMFARGEFDLGPGSPALTLPHAAVLPREGFHYVFRIGPDSRVVLTKVGVGRRMGDRVEVLSGIDAGSRVVAIGAGLLGDGDLVSVSPADGAAMKTVSGAPRK